MPCWICKAAILAVVIVLAILSAKYSASVAAAATVAAATTEAIATIVQTLASNGLLLSPLVVTGLLGILAGFILNELAAWICCKVGVTACC
jgi:hypothetical protein